MFVVDDVVCDWNTWLQ